MEKEKGEGRRKKPGERERGGEGERRKRDWDTKKARDISKRDIRAGSDDRWYSTRELEEFKIELILLVV